MAPRTSETPSAENDRSHVERNFVSLDDLRLCLIMPFWLLLSWIMPQRWWPFVTRWLAGTTMSRTQLAHEDAVLAGRLDTVALQKARPSIAIGYHAARIEHFFQILRDYRPGGWKPKIEIIGLEHVDDAMANGKGGLLWVGHFAFNGLAPKMAMQRAGYPLSHLSRPEHGFSKTAFGIRVLNPIRAGVEDRYLRRRILIERGRESVATRQLRECLIRGEIVSITAGAWEGRMVEQAGIFGSSLPLSTGAPSLARSTGAALLPLFVVRETDSNVLKIVIDRPIEFGAHLSRDEARSHAVAEFAGRMEAWVRTCPEQWRDWRYVAPEFKYDRGTAKSMSETNVQDMNEFLQEARNAAENGYFERCLSICRTILATRPRHFATRKLMAELSGKMGKPSKAIELVDALIAEKPKKGRLISLLILKTRLALNDGDLSMADKLCKRAIALDENDRNARRQMNNLLSWSGRWEELDGMLTELIRSPSDNVETIAHAIRNMMNGGRLGAASVWLKKLTESVPGSPFVTALCSKSYRRDGDEEKAREIMLTTNLTGFESSHNIRNTALELHGIGLVDEAGAFWRKFQQLEPISYDARFALADIAIREDRFDEARDLIEIIARDSRDRGRSVALISFLQAKRTGNGREDASAGSSETLAGLKNMVMENLPDPLLMKRLEITKAALLDVRQAVSFSSEQPKITLVCPIHRPCDLNNAVTQLTRQRWDNLETIIALHTAEIGEGDIAALWTVDRPVTVIDCAGCATIGAVLNRAIRKSSGDVIMKIDADDLYFPNYVADMARSLQFHNADVVVKKSKFRFFHDTGLLVLEYPQMINRKAERGEQAGGTALCMRRPVFERVPFQEELRTAEDTIFFTQASIAGLKIVFVDPFNHIAQRSVQLVDHTWRTENRIMLLGARRTHVMGDQSAFALVEV